MIKEVKAIQGKAQCPFCQRLVKAVFGEETPILTQPNCGHVLAIEDDGGPDISSFSFCDDLEERLRF